MTETKQKSKDDLLKQARASVTSQDVIAFLVEKVPSLTCPMCQKGPWAIPAPNDKLQYVMWPLMGPGGETVLGQGLPVVPITCTNCGNTWSLAALPLWEWFIKKTGMTADA